MECPPSSPPRLLPGFAPNKNAKFQIYQDNALASAALLPTPLPTSERDVESSPGRESASQTDSSAPLPTRRVLEQLKTIRLRPDIPMLVGRSSRACDFVLKCTNKLVSRIHARVCFEAASDLVTVECLGWNGLSVIVPGKKGTKEYPVIRNQTIYIEKVNGIEISIQNIRTFVEVASAPSETTEDEADFKNVSPKQPDSSPLRNLEPIKRSKADVIEKTIAALKVTSGPSDTPATPSTVAASSNDSYKENVTPRRVHFALDVAGTPPSKVELSRPKATTLAEYRERRRSLVQETRPVITAAASKVDSAALDAPFEPCAANPVAKQGEEQSKGPATKQPAVNDSEADVMSNKIQKAYEEPEEPIQERDNNVTVNEPMQPQEKQAPEKITQVEAPTEPVPSEPIAAVEPAVETATDTTIDTLTPAPTDPITMPRKRKATTNKPITVKKPRTSSKNTSAAIDPNTPLQVDTTSTETFGRLAANCVAFSRLNSTPLSHIIASSHELEGIEPAVIAQILQGMACVGVIQREGKDALGKPLEPEYYYISELDPNTERQQMVMQSKGGKSLRACRRAHKQYFYKRPK